MIREVFTRPGACPLAFASLLVGWVASGCLVPDPPSTSAAEKTPPVLILAEANPPVYQILQLAKDDPTPQITFDVPVRSEDAGDPLRATLYLNWNVPGTPVNNVVDRNTIQPSTFSDTSRIVWGDWDYGNQPAGCKQIVLLVTHASNYDATDFPELYANPADTAMATWFINLGDVPTGKNALSGCPSSSGIGQ
jgi:hypothetical protein